MIARWSLWAIARHTFSQCLRMKIAVAFIVLLAVLLSVLPFTMKGDGTLAGSIRTFLSYSVSATGVLLSLVTVLVTARVVTSDVEEKQIYLLAVKPVSRWQYIVGRWLGVLLLDVVLLAIAGSVIYFVAKNMQTQPAKDATDRRAIETEIFSARREVKPEPFNVEQAVVVRLDQLQKTGQLAIAVQEYQDKANISREEAQQRVLMEIQLSEMAKMETVEPGKKLSWTFHGLGLDEAVANAQGTVVLEGRNVNMFRIAAPREFLGKLMYDRPVNVDGVRGFVREVSEKDFDVEFEPANMKRAEIERLTRDATVALVTEPTFQFRYKASAIGRTDISSMYRQIEFYSLDNQLEEAFRGTGPVGAAATLSVPATGALRTGSFRVDYLNPMYQPTANPEKQFELSPEVRIPAKDVSILYRVSSFEMNFFQSMLMIFIQLVFLAALAVFLASFLSFPVAAMTVLVFLGAGMLLGWLTESIQWDGGLTNRLGAYMLLVVKLFMPSLAQTSPSDTLVDGIYLSWPVVGITAALSIGVRGVVYLLLGCLIFHRRELAKVQV